MKQIINTIKKNPLLILIILVYIGLVFIFAEHINLFAIKRNKQSILLHANIFYGIFALFISFLVIKLISDSLKQKNIRPLVLSLVTFLTGCFIRYIVFFPAFERSVLPIWILKAAKMLSIDTRLYGLPLLTRLSFTFLPRTADAVLIMNIIMGSLAPILFFYLTKELFRDKKLPLTASILLFISPTYLFISSTESYTAPALFYAIITFLFLFKFFNKNQLNYLVISLLALALTIFMRQEYILVLIPYFITFFSYNNKKIPTNQLFLIGLLLLILVPYSSELMHYYSNTGYDKFLHGKVIQTEDWITSFGKNYIKLGSENLLPNLKTLFSNQCILLANVFLALCAIPFIIKKHKKQFIFISAYFGTFFLAYTFMHTEGFHNSGLKYITGLLIPVILLSSYCINTVANKIQKKGGKNAALFVRILILSVILICSIVSVIDMAGNNSGAYYVREYQTLKNLDYKINTSCTPICNGRDCIFPSAFDFRQKHIAITSLGRLKMLLESNNSNCYYFYIGYIDEQSDKNEGNKRIYDIEKLTLELTNNSFQLILEKEIRNEKKIYLFERK